MASGGGLRMAGGAGLGRLLSGFRRLVDGHRIT